MKRVEYIPENRIQYMLISDHVLSLQNKLYQRYNTIVIGNGSDRILIARTRNASIAARARFQVQFRSLYQGAGTRRPRKRRGMHNQEQYLTLPSINYFSCLTLHWLPVPIPTNRCVPLLHKRAQK